MGHTKRNIKDKKIESNVLATFVGQLTSISVSGTTFQFQF
jgi:hypothetical protein